MRSICLVNIMQKANYFPSLINVSSQQFKLIISQCTNVSSQQFKLIISQCTSVYSLFFSRDYESSYYTKAWCSGGFCRQIESLIYHGNQHLHLDNQVGLWDIEDLIEEERE